MAAHPGRHLPMLVALLLLLSAGTTHARPTAPRPLPVPDHPAPTGCPTPLPAPGGVRDPSLCDLTVWLKANGTVTETGGLVSGWADASGLGSHVTQSDPALQPLYQIEQANFNPSISFSGGLAGPVLSGTLPGLIPDQPYTLFMVINPANVLNDNVFGIGTPDQPDSRRAIGYHTNVAGGRLHFHWGDNLVAPGPLDGWQVITFRYSAQAASTDRFLVFNGLEEISDDTTLNLPADPPLYVGGFPRLGPPRDQFTGEMGEFIFYSSPLSATEQNQVESYLAIKYGITLGTSSNPVSYQDSAASTLWDGPANATYHHNIGGIGRDDASALDQRKSKSINPGALVTIEHAAPFATDRSFLLWGNNALTTTVAITEGQALRMGRVWLVQEQGTVPTVTISLSATAGIDTLFVDEDGDFTNATARPLTDDGTGTLRATVDLADGQFVSFGQVLPPTAVRLTRLDSGHAPGVPMLPLALALLTLAAGVALARQRRAA